MISTSPRSDGWTSFARAGAVPSISQTAFDLQGYPNNRVMFNALISRLGQAIVGEMTLDEAYQRMTDDVAQQIAEKERGG